MGRSLARKSPDDVVQNALEKTLMGDSHPKEGRKLSVKDRQCMDNFLEFVRGIINSDISNTVRSTEVSIPHDVMGDPETEPSTVDVPDPVELEKLLELQDFQRELFARLELVLQNEPELEPVIRFWSEHFYGTDRIAGPKFDQHRVFRVRQHARRICRELAQEIEPGAVTGMEMLL